MSAYRDTLPDEARARYDDAVRNAGGLLAAALADLTQDGAPLAERAA